MKVGIKILSLTILAVFFGFLHPANASADSFLDESYGTSGKVVTSFGHEAGANRVALQSDGKAIVAGYASNGSNNDWAITRYNTDGSLDNSFGTNGKVIQNLGNNDQIKALKIQSDGKLVVGGIRYLSGSDFRWEVARYNSNGSLDSSFGSGGIVTTIFANDNNGNPYGGEVRDIAIQSDGKIVAVGYTYNGRDNVYEVAIARYNTDGSLDTGFGTGGTKHIRLVEPGSSLNAVVIQSDNKILVYGSKTDGVYNTIYIIRFNTDGSSDTGFGSGGQVHVPRFGDHDYSTDMTLQSDSKILLTGTYTNSSSNDTFVLRYNSNGTVDTSFANAGQFLNSYASGNDGANSITVSPDGSILLGGYNPNATNNDFAIRKLLANGTIDASFGASGSEIIPMGNGGSSIASVKLDSIPRIIAVGNATNGNYNDWALIRSSSLIKIEIATSPNSANVSVGTPFNVDVKVNDAGQAFNAAQATVNVSSNLQINSINTARSNACNFNYTKTPTTSDPSFAGAIFNGSSTGCTMYTMTLTPRAAGAGTITFNNPSIKSYTNGSEILTNVHNGSYTISAATPSPTPPGTTLITVDDSVQGGGQNQWNYINGTWSHCADSSSCSVATLYNNSASWANTTDEYAMLAFTGTQIKVYGLVDPNYGIGAVSIDGGSETSIDFYSSNRLGNVLLWTSPILAPSSHTLKVRVTGAHNSNSTNNYVVVDRADVLQTGPSGLTVINTVFDTYNSTFTLSGTKNASITHVFVNGSEAGVSFGTSTTWQAVKSVSLGNNDFIIYGTDDNNIQSASINVSVNRHALADINGDGIVDLTDASLFAVDWGKTSNLTYPLSDMNGDGAVDLTDLSILAKLEN